MSSNPAAFRSPKPNAGMVKDLARSPMKHFIFYLIVAALLTSLLGLRFFANYAHAHNTFLVFQVVLTGLGVVHAWYIRYRLGWSEASLLIRQIGYTLLTALVGAVLFMVIGLLLVNIGKERISLDELMMFAPAWMMFPAPYLVAMTFEMAIHIPKKKYKLWFYNENQKLPDFDLVDFSNSLILSFEFPKRFNDTNVSNFKFKAPVNMNFCDLFYGYLNEYNERHRDQPIEHYDADGKAYGWLFYVHTGSSWKKKIIDPHLSISQNGIKEKDIILPKRFIVAD